MSHLDQIFKKLGPAQPPSTSQSRMTNQVPASTDANKAKTPIPTMVESNIEPMLDNMAAQVGGNLNWKSSLPDLLTVLGVDSSLAARQAMAQELQYPGDANDSEDMNSWVHKELMKRLAENGGTAPPEATQ